MRLKRIKKSENGFIFLLLDFLFVAIGIIFLILGLLENGENYASIIRAFKGSF